jgi:hypothetical protein
MNYAVTTLQVTSEAEVVERFFLEYNDVISGETSDDGKLKKNYQSRRKKILKKHIEKIKKYTPTLLE